MSLKRQVRPIELVVSAIYRMRKDKGSTIKDILKFIEQRYRVNGDEVKFHVLAGLKKGLSMGILNQEGGLYKLNKVLSSLKMESVGKILQQKKRKQTKTRSKPKEKEMRRRRKEGNAMPKKNAVTKLKKKRSTTGKESKNKRLAGKKSKKTSKNAKTSKKTQRKDLEGSSSCKGGSIRNVAASCDQDNRPSIVMSKECEISNK